MSAFTVSPETINLIVSYAGQSMSGIKIKDKIYDFKKQEDLQEIAQMLMNENYRSVNSRYKENDQPLQIKFKPSFVGPKKTIDVIKCCDCLEYQSCETDDYESTDAYKILNRIRKDAVLKILKLNGYSDAPWGL